MFSNAFIIHMQNKTIGTIDRRGRFCFFYTCILLVLFSLSVEARAQINRQPLIDCDTNGFTEVGSGATGFVDELFQRFSKGFNISGDGLFSFVSKDEIISNKTSDEDSSYTPDDLFTHSVGLFIVVAGIALIILKRDTERNDYRISQLENQTRNITSH